MKIIRNVNEMKAYSRAVHKKGGTIGFVPTMGYLHEGHMSLVRAARKDCDRTVVSIFVNPTQFGPKEDLKKYPRDMDRDVKMLTKEKADVVFVPETDEIYPENFATYVEVSGPIVSGMCGASRPGHFKGVATVVTKLFNIVCPDISYFGQKDAQQAAVIKRMVRDLDLETRVKVMPIVRETDGLAMSSRNKYLSPEERARAVNIHRALNNAKDMIKRGERSAKKIKNNINSILKKNKIKTDYIELADRDSMSPLDVLEKGKTIIAVAAYVGKTRLIDNVIV
ncbi:MAG TPA: pantoate--beta-alanine ligase [Candidatus Omnitrophota bacterium]|nr:pantoate--beta-alanine ligase [Candidatus Omnitrophota bacterium]HPS20705.1 pantoate--beta-alanine ligase [Candidatus Omnitrophota bacterium]